MKRRGRPKRIEAIHHDLLRELALQQPQATLGELVKAFQSRTGVLVHSATLSKALKTAGIRRVRPPVRQAATDEKTTRRYGYQDRHLQND